MRDLEALGRACANKNAELVLGQKTFKNFNRGARCDHAIRLLDAPNAYEVGVVRQPDETYSFDWDNWGPGGALQQRFGAGLVGLVNEYTAVVAEDKMRAEGYMVQRYDEGQRIVLQVQR